MRGICLAARQVGVYDRCKDCKPLTGMVECPVCNIGIRVLKSLSLQEPRSRRQVDMPRPAVALLSPRLARNGLAGHNVEALIRRTASFNGVNSGVHWF